MLKRFRFASVLVLSASLAAACAGGELDAPAAPLGSGGSAGAGGTGGAGGGGPLPVGPLGMRADLPVDSAVTISGLSGPVDIVRDKFGRVHVYATSVTDAMRVEGFLVASDRHGQLEILRRLSEGRMAAILGDVQPSLIDTDIAFRHIGLGRTAKAQYDALPPGSELRAILDAYADGITQAFKGIKAGHIAVPKDVKTLLADTLDDWTGVDSLAIGRLQTWLLSYDAQSDMDLTDALAALRGTFSTTATDPQLKARAGLERDLVRFQAEAPATTTTGYPTKTALTKPSGGPTPARVPADLDAIRAAIRAARDVLAATGRGFGSNNWAIKGSRTTTGHAMVASDPHLNLTAPAIFWPVSLDVSGADKTKDLHVSGMAFPGIPGIILGHNEHIAWGATVAAYDVTDVYSETVSADGSGVTYKGATVPFQTISEKIDVAGGTSVTYDVKVVPHHGPVFPVVGAGHKVAAPSGKAMSVRWTGLEPTTELAAVLELVRATSVDEARTALKQFGVGAQNWMLGDDKGDILWTSHANVPIRPKGAFTWDATKYTGQLPCMVLPGDGTAEWGAYLDDDLVPWAKNPTKGYISTANNDPIGVTLDNDPSNDLLPDGTPMYLGCFWDSLREARIQERIEAHTAPFAPDDLASIQADVKSPLGSRLAPKLIAAIDRAELERTKAGSASDLAGVVADKTYVPAKVQAARALLDAWAKDAEYAAESGVDPDTNQPLAATGDSAVKARASQATLLFNAWLINASTLVLGDEIKAAKLGSYASDQRLRALLRMYTVDATTLATYDATRKDSVLWDDLTTTEIESRDERTMRALLAAITYVDTLPGGADGARWGQHHRVTFDAIVPLFSALSIPAGSDPTFPNGFPRHGDLHVVDASMYGPQNLDGDAKPSFTYSDGPAQRMVAELDPAGPKVANALPGGNVWDDKSPHFRDEAEFWRKNQTHAIPITLDDVVKAKESRVVAVSK
jgi:penicillin amidase